MKNNSKNVAVFIGRFQPFHLGHEYVVEQALNSSNNYQHLIFLLGSAEQARTPKNPFNFSERKKIIETTVERLQEKNKTNLQISILPLHDYIYDNQKWISEVQNLIHSVTNVGNENIFLIGNLKDKSSEYLNYFPQYQKEQSGLFKINKSYLKNSLNATNIRESFFNLFDTKKQKGLKLVGLNFSKDEIIDQLPEIFEERLGENTIKFLQLFIKEKKEEYENLVNEYNYIQSYQKTMKEKLPFENIAFFTGDSLVTCAGHLLLIKRKIAPGKGLYALPGGFFDGKKDLNQVETAIRELKEETKIKLDKDTLKLHIVKSMDFGDFNRSERWRVLTKATYIKLPYNKLPEVKGADDAEYAVWMPFVEIKKNRDKFFEDHLSIIDTFLNIL